VDWLTRVGPPTTGSDVRAPEARKGEERSTRGVAALLDGVHEDRSHSVLDLGTAAGSSLQLYGRFAQRVRFADILSHVPSIHGGPNLVDALPPQPEAPYDLLFAWDILDCLFPYERPRLIQRLAEISSIDARLHVIVDTSDSEIRQALRFTLLASGRMLCEPTGANQPSRGRMLPAEVEKILLPFQVVRAFTLKGGLREYVAVRRGAGH